MTSREQFEEWVTKETGFDLWRTEFPMTEWDDQQYKCHQTNLSWMAWQASRAAVEVEVNRLNIEIENLECAHICLDDVGVPRKEGDETLSLWGRIVSYKSSTEGR